MQKKATIGGWIYIAWFYTIFGVMLIILYPLIIYGLRNPKRHFWVYRLRRRGCRLVLLLTGIRNRVHNRAPWPEGPVVYVCNHTSLLDILVGLAVIPQPVIYVGKEELAGIPLFGKFFKYLDIPVQRGNAERGEWLLGETQRRLELGWSIVWFPEGTTSAIAPGILRFKNGAFRLAMQARVPVVPLTFVDHWRLQHYDKPGDNRPGINRIVVGEPLHPSDDPSAMIGLRNEARSAIINEIYQWWGGEPGGVGTLKKD